MVVTYIRLNVIKTLAKFNKQTSKKNEYLLNLYKMDEARLKDEMKLW